MRAGVLNEAKSSVFSLNLTRGHSESWLSIPAAGSQGLCDSSKRRPVLFNENVLSRCKLSLSNDNFTKSGCANMSANIVTLLLGHRQANELVIAAFGDSEWGSLTDWVPVIYKDLPQEGKFSEILIFNKDNKTEKSVVKSDSDVGYCGGIATNLNIQFLWTSVGSHSSPQSKILGILYNFGDTSLLEPPRTRQTLGISLVISISFTDVTPPVQSKFAPLPKYEIRLPRDFFYPLFSMSKSSMHFLNHMLCLLITIIFICI